jgi:hypothetical protein
MRSRLSESFVLPIARVLVFALAAAALAGCSSTQTVPHASSPKDASLLQKASLLLRPGRNAGALSESDADSIMALAIAEHEMRHP